STQPRTKITRNRELRACIECRIRKLKCDRRSPCSACTRRNAGATCVYDRNITGIQEEHDMRLRAEARVEYLEQLVQQLSRSSSGDGDETTVSSGEVEITALPPSEVMYNGSTHWSAMLEDVEELGSGEGGSDLSSAIDDDDGTRLLFGQGKPLPYREILSQFLPPRRDADRLVASYFRSKAIVAPFIHSGQFSRMYHKFWDDPASTSPLWTSILFSVLDISARTLSQSSAGSHSRFAVAAAHCLTAGSYFRARPLAVEALVLYAQRKCITSMDMSSDLAVLFGILIRLAITQGYHRDASKIVGISPFAVEMRRRTWSLAMQLDLFVSFQLGLPSTVQYPTWDTPPPTNLLDSDFDEDTIELPPARPDTEHTELLFYVAKHKLMAVFEKIVRLTQSVGAYTDSEVDAIDAELRVIHTSLPIVFQPRSLAESVADSPSIIVTRLCVEFIYLKCLCVLHRRFVTRGRKESVQTCCTAATDLLRRSLQLRTEFEPGGQLETEKWFMGSITWHDFLLGCMALCLVLCITRQ
ncbi:hypothetical protein BU16DRAFT_427943, partial [Lophium mytilinum]